MVDPFTDILSPYTFKVAEAMFSIEEMGMIPEMIYPLRLNDDGSATIKVGVDIEATARSQSRTKYEMPELINAR